MKNKGISKKLIINGKLNPFVFWYWLIATTLVGLMLIPGTYDFGTASMKYLSNAPSAQSKVGSQNGRVGLWGGNTSYNTDVQAFEMSDGRMLIIDYRQTYIFNPKNNKYYSSIGDREIKTGEELVEKVEGSTGSFFTGRYFVPLSDKQRIAIASGRTLSIWDYRDRLQHVHTLDYAFGGSHIYVVQLQEDELLLAGSHKSVIEQNQDGETVSKLFKYDLKTNKLTDTGKLAPVRLNENANQFSYHDFGKEVIVWDRSTGNLYSMNKGNLKFKKIATGMQTEPKPELNYKIYPVNKNQVFIAESTIHIEDDVYVYDSRWNKLTKFKLSDKISGDNKSRAINEQDQSIRYNFIVTGDRFLNLVSRESYNFSNTIKNFWDHRLVYDLKLHKFVNVSKQQTELMVGSTREDQESVWKMSVLPNNQEIMVFGGNGLDAIYKPSIKIASIGFMTWGHLQKLFWPMFIKLILGGIFMGHVYFKNRRIEITHRSNKRVI